MRKTGQTTRNLVSVLNSMLHDETTPYYLFVMDDGIREAARQARMFASLLDVLGMEPTMISESACQYTVKWNGKPLYKRNIYFATKPFEMEVYALKRMNAKNCKTYYDISD